MLTVPPSRGAAVVLAFVLFTAGCAGLAPTESQAPTAETIETRLAHGPDVETVSGRYTVTEAVAGEAERSSVRVWEVAGERVRQEISSPTRPDRVVVANRSGAWVYFPDRETAYRRGFTVVDQTGVQPYSYAALIGNLGAYRVEYRGRETVANRSTHHVALLPAEDGGALPELEFYTYHIDADSGPATVRPTRVELWLDTENWFPLKHELRVGNGTRDTYTATISYDDVAFNESIDPSRLSFDPTSREETEIVIDDVETVYRSFDELSRAEARAGLVYGSPEAVGRYRLDRTAVVEAATGRAIKGLYLPEDTEASDAATRITRPTHPDAVTVTVSAGGTYRDLVGLPALDGDRRTIAGVAVEYRRLPGRWTEVTFSCGDTTYSIAGNGNVDVDTMGTFVGAVTCR